MNKKDTTITDEPTKLLDIKLDISCYNSMNHGSVRFKESEIKTKLKKLGFNVDQDYVLMRTVANPLAVDLISANSKELSIKRYGKNPDLHVYFSADINETYLEALDHLTKDYGFKHAYYPLIVEDGIHHIGLHEEQPSWPVIHIVEAEHEDAFKNLILNDMHSSVAYKFICQKEAPQNYHMSVFNLLHDTRVRPLNLEERVWKVKGADLKNAVDFLSQYIYSYEMRDRGSMLDD